MDMANYLPFSFNAFRRRRFASRIQIDRPDRVKSSCAPSMRWLAATIPLVLCLSACSHDATDFDLVIANRTRLPIRVFVDSQDLGVVGAGQVTPSTIHFAINVVVHTDPTGKILTAPNWASSVNIIARELKDGTLSPSQSTRLVEGWTNNIEFSPVCPPRTPTWACDAP
jgi:hypothetical protein